MKKRRLRVIKRLAQGRSQEMAEMGFEPLYHETQRPPHLLKDCLEPVLDETEALSWRQLIHLSF